jgi:hypothetical protein
MVTSDDDKTTDIIVEADTEEITRMSKVGGAAWGAAAGERCAPGCSIMGSVRSRRGDAAVAAQKSAAPCCSLFRDIDSCLPLHIYTTLHVLSQELGLVEKGMVYVKGILEQ